MAIKKKDEKEITVVAELTVSYDQVEIIRTFDKAWHRLLLVPTPATMSFRAWVRKN